MLIRQEFGIVLAGGAIKPDAPGVSPDLQRPGLLPAFMCIRTPSPSAWHVNKVWLEEHQATPQVPTYVSCVILLLSVLTLLQRCFPLHNSRTSNAPSACKNIVGTAANATPVPHMQPCWSQRW